MASKNEIRRNIRQIRDDHSPSAAASAEICSRLLGLEAVRDAKAWFIYASAGSEVGTHDLIRILLARGDIVAVPRVIGPQDIVAQQIHSFDELRLSEFGILAPAPEICTRERSLSASARELPSRNRAIGSAQAAGITIGSCRPVRRGWSLAWRSSAS